MMADKELRELQAIKKLLVALLLKLGASSQEIATAMDVDSSVVRHMMAVKKIARIKGIS